MEIPEYDKEFNDVLSIGPRRGRKNMFKTPEGYYKTSRRQISPDSIERRVREGKKEMYNPVTNRWIADNTSNRNSIKTQKKRTNIRSRNAQLPAIEESITSSIQSSPLNPNVLEDVEYFEDDYAVLPDYIEPEKNIKELDKLLDSVYCRDKYVNNLPVDLNNVNVIDLKVTFENSDIYLGRNRYDNPQLELKNIPCMLEYNGVILNVIKYISRGSFGSVLSYSEDTPLPPNWVKVLSRDGRPESFGTYYYNNVTGKATFDRPRIEGQKYYELAVKTYSNQSDSEIKLINELNDSNSIIESDVGMCNTVNSKILETRNKYTNRYVKFAIMDIMDGTLYDLIKDGGLNQEQINEITLSVAKSLYCLLPNFSYTDLKSQNVLFKCYKGNNGMGRIKIVLGDIGSICKVQHHTEQIWTDNYYMASPPESGGPATYPPPEAILDPGNAPCTENTMVWDIGVLFLELLGFNTVEDFYHSSTTIEEIIDNGGTRQSIEASFINTIRNTVLPIINRIYDLSDYILYSPDIPNTGNFNLYDLIRGIMNNKDDRLNLEKVIKGFSNIPID